MSTRPSAEALEEFGKPPPGGYVLSIWRGEWSDYYSSWERRSTVPRDRSAYYLLGNRSADAMIHLGLGVVLLTLGWRLWPIKRER